jgi:hypothetical protein
MSTRRCPPVLGGLWTGRTDSIAFRVARNDNTVVFGKLELQLPRTSHRAHFARCPVTVHQFLEGKTLGVSFQGQLIARVGTDGQPIRKAAKLEAAAQANTTQGGHLQPVMART